MQGLAGDMKKVLQASERTHWAAMLLDSSLSRTRRMKGLIMLLFCEHWSIRGAAQKDRDAVPSLCESNGIALCEQSMLPEHPDREMQSTKKRKGKHSKKHKKKRKHTRRDSTDSDTHRAHSDTDDLQDTAPHTAVAGAVWDLAFDTYKATVAFGDISEHILSICACIRYEAYVKVHG